ncbi:MAG TPA: hypothetical protein VFV67_12495 [Actinophytocola sp.]|uniref:WXG100 family type VII secretion target n=1 Tax=Actinophytocola sp. TaxID=1872138 RepID=UPI002DB6F4DB|nr:hypothetical protein [Actinophytocola sp.]HEU5471466.1 hypothetical protein [Actinophytocola sp.]
MTAPVIDTAFEDAVAAVRDAVDRLREIWNDIVDGVNHVLGILPGFLEGPVKDAFNNLSGKVTEALDKIWQFYTERGSASAVRQVASDWNTEVGGAASEQAGLLTPAQLASTGQWSGTAATRYTQVVGNQTKALADVKTITDSVQTTLNEIADALRNFWVGLAVAVGAYIASMVGCAIGAATVVGAVPSLIAALGFSVTFIGAAVKLALDFSNALDAKKAKLEQQTTLNGSFASDSWPPATAGALADGSVRDGDKSDWTPAS